MFTHLQPVFGVTRYMSYVLHHYIMKKNPIISHLALLHVDIIFFVFINIGDVCV